MISCGCCKTKHETVAQVKACYAAKYAKPKPQAQVAATVPTPELDLKTPAFVAAIQAHEQAEADAVAFFKAGFTAGELKPVKTPGMYKRDGRVYRVKPSKAGNLYAQLVTLFDGKPIYAYAKGAMKTLSADDKMSLEDAEAYSLKINHCCCCGKTLTNTKSVALGIGPVCRKKYF